MPAPAGPPAPRGAVTIADIRRARERIAGLVDPSPVIRSERLSAVAGVEVWLKLENLQPPGSFKVRGAASKMLSLTEQQRSHGVITCSGGNHGAAVAYVAARLGMRATVCVPRTVDPVKLAAIRDHGAEAVVEGDTFDEAVVISHRLQVERNLTYVHPFDDPDVIAGQGTIALELCEQVPGFATVAAAVSGGGLAGGIGTAVAAIDPQATVIGVSAERAATMAASVRAGHPVDLPYRDTLAEVLTGGIGAGNAWSLAAVRAHVAAHVLVTEEHIAAGMRFALRHHRIVVEGGGAVPIGAVLAGLLPGPRGAGPLVLIVSGGNVDPAAILALPDDQPAGVRE